MNQQFRNFLMSCLAISLVSTFARADGEKQYLVETYIYSVAKDVSSLSWLEAEKQGKIELGEELEGKVGDSVLQLTKEGVRWDGKEAPADASIKLLSAPTLTIVHGEPATIRVGPRKTDPETQEAPKGLEAIELELEVTAKAQEPGGATVIETELTITASPSLIDKFTNTTIAKGNLWTRMHSQTRDGHFFLVLSRCIPQ